MAAVPNRRTAAEQNASLLAASLVEQLSNPALEILLGDSMKVDAFMIWKGRQA